MLFSSSVSEVDLVPYDVEKVLSKFCNHRTKAESQASSSSEDGWEHVETFEIDPLDKFMAIPPFKELWASVEA